MERKEVKGLIKAIIEWIKKIFKKADPPERYAVYVSGTTAICPLCKGYMKIRDGETVICHDCRTHFICVDIGVNPRSLVFEVDK